MTTATIRTDDRDAPCEVEIEQESGKVVVTSMSRAAIHMRPGDQVELVLTIPVDSFRSMPQGVEEAEEVQMLQHVDTIQLPVDELNGGRDREPETAAGRSRSRGK